MNCLFSGHWIRFQDEGGAGWAQPDFFIPAQNHVILLEAKLSQKPEAWDQLRLLYIPLLEHLFHRPVRPYLICRNLRYPVDPILELPDIFRPGKPSEGTIHYLN